METLQGGENDHSNAPQPDEDGNPPEPSEGAPESESSAHTAVLLELGRQLRRLRIKRGLSLARLGEQAGVSRAMLCQIELGQSAPTVTLLAKIARALRVSLGSIVGSLEEPTVLFVPARRTESYRSSDGRYETRVIFSKKRSVPAVEEYRLDAGLTDLRLQLPPNAFVQLIVTKGQIEARVGERTFSLASGDGVLFDSECTTKLANSGAEVAVFLLTVSPRDES